MYRHGPTCLEGPVTKERSCWKEPFTEEPGSEAPAAEVRHDLVARVRADIAAGIYETPEKVEIALERFLEQTIHP